jgi:hypothetical protein
MPARVVTVIGEELEKIDCGQYPIIFDLKKAERAF